MMKQGAVAGEETGLGVDWTGLDGPCKAQVASWPDWEQPSAAACSAVQCSPGAVQVQHRAAANCNRKRGAAAGGRTCKGQRRPGSGRGGHGRQSTGGSTGYIQATLLLSLQYLLLEMLKGRDCPGLVQYLDTSRVGQVSWNATKNRDALDAGRHASQKEHSIFKGRW